MGRRIQGKTVIIIVALCILAGVTYAGWHNGLWLDKWENKAIDYDFDRDGVSERITLKNRKMKISLADELLWESDDEWKVVDFLIGDINCDSENEVLLLVWKRGSYGEYTPFWDENDNSFSQHIFIFKWVDERLDPIWMSSMLRPQVKSWDLTEDNEIHIITDSGEDTLWIWGRWGLERVK